MRPYIPAILLLSAMLAGCVSSAGSSDFSIATPIGRPVLPPQEHVSIGSLYYVQESPTSDRTTPADIQPLCIVNLGEYGIATLPPNRIPDINLLRVLDAQGSLSGIKTALVSVGLKGKVSKYYELKLTDVTKVGISRDDAEAAFDQLSSGPKCKKWFDNVSMMAIYQVESVYVGDLSFGRKSGAGLNASVSAKLAQIEPQIEAELASQTQSSLAGSDLVFAFVPIRRN